MSIRINVFEGARRVALLLAALWVIGVVVIGYADEPRVHLSYLVLSPHGTPKSNFDGTTSCSADDRQEYKSLRTAKGTSLWVTICFKSLQFPKGEMLVPYKENRDGTMWGAGKYSREVSSYTESYASEFRLPAVDEGWADGRYWPERWEQAKISGAWLVGGVFALWLFTAVAGWIVRGFAGIPMGMDRRPRSE
jgi:hypothetical protein